MKKINIAELLKDCPIGMELDCTIFNGKVYFEGFDNNTAYPLKISINLVNIEHLDIYGQYNTRDYAKCVIFPKGKTTWEGFQRPFKDGEIVVYDNPHRDNLQVFIFKNKKENNTLSSCYLMLDGDELDLEEGMYYVTRLATEEEKRKLFKAIKEHGYRWNPETKTLEKLPKFKVGDKIKLKGGDEFGITEVSDCFYTIKNKNNTHCWPIKKQDDWELINEPKFKALKTQEEINNYLSKISIKDANNLLSIEKRLEDDKLVLPDSILVNKNSGTSSSEFIEWYRCSTSEEYCDVAGHNPEELSVDILQSNKEEIMEVL